MNRRRFLQQTSAALPMLTFAGAVAPAFGMDTAQVPPWRTFELTTRLEPNDRAGPTQLWVPVPAQQRREYQRRLDLTWHVDKPARAELVTLPGYDVQLLHIMWPDAKSVGAATVVSRVMTRDRSVDLAISKFRSEEPQNLRRYLMPTALLPTDGIVRTTADRIAKPHDSDVDRARAIYAWVVDNTNRDPKTQGCGAGDVGAMLETGYLGGKCADINGLFVALARSVGIPARDAYGVRLAESRLGYKCLGRNGDVTKAQHCRAEFYARGHGWVPVDPADVRKIMLEEPPGGLSIDDPKVQSARARLFGSWEMNWIAYNYGHDVALPGSNRKPIPFLMYPQGRSGEHRFDSLDPAAFGYTITSREIA